MILDGKLPELERLALIKSLNSLAETEFKELVFALKPPPGEFPVGAAAQGDSSSKLLQWAEESPTGPGLIKLQEVLNRVLGKESEQTASTPDGTFAQNLGIGVKLEMVYIPEGRFWMGSPAREEGRYNNECPQRRVSVPAFFMGKYPVTQRQWHAVSLRDDVNRHLNPDPSASKGDNLPVECVSWGDAIEFCKRLSRHTCKDYRLPSEAEWEYACRAGTTTPYHFGKGFPFALSIDSLFGQDGTREVGQFQPNGFGLYDMHGNVWEWCLDHSHDNYEGAPTDGRAWIEGGGSGFRVIRGGSWTRVPRNCRSAYRDWNYPYFRSNDIGFRVCCSPPRSLP